MDASSVARLQSALADVELQAEEVLIARRDMVECDRARNGNREALTALRRQAKTSRSSVPPSQRRALVTEIGLAEIGGAGGVEKCLSCGDHDGTSPQWVMCRSSDVFLSLPFHATHQLLEAEERDLEQTSRRLQGDLKEKALLLADKGGLSDGISTSLLRSYVNLKDDGG